MSSNTPFEEVALMASDLLLEVNSRLTAPDDTFDVSLARAQVANVADHWAKRLDDHDPDVVYAGATFAVGCLVSRAASLQEAGHRPSTTTVYHWAQEDAEYHQQLLK